MPAGNANSGARSATGTTKSTAAATPSCTMPSMTTPGWAYSEILHDERKETAAAFWERAKQSFSDHGILIKAVLTETDPVAGQSFSPKHWAPESSTTRPALTGPRSTG